LADSDAKTLFASSDTITKDTLLGQKIFVMEDGTLEQLMKDISPETYSSVEKEFGSSKQQLLLNLQNRYQRKIHKPLIR